MIADAYNPVAEAIKRACGKLSQKEIAERLDVSPSYVCEVLLGRRSLSIRLAYHIERVFRGFSATDVLHEQLDLQIEAELSRPVTCCAKCSQTTRYCTCPPTGD